MASLMRGLVFRTKGKVLEGSGSGMQVGGTGLPGKGPQQVMSTSNTLFTFVGSAGNGADTTEDLLSSTSLLANAFDTASSFEFGNARGLWMYAWGSTVNNTDVKTARLYFGTSIVLSIAPTVSAVTPWALELLVLKSGANAQRAQGQAVNGATHTGVQNFNGTENDQAAITLKVTGQSSVANANDITLIGWQVLFFN
jgi:hypothetical protein